MPTLLQAPPAPTAGQGSSGYALAARRAAPAVVSVTATKMTRRSPHANDPRFKFFFGEEAVGQQQIGLGSGVIVSPEGYLLTNHQDRKSVV